MNNYLELQKYRNVLLWIGVIIIAALHIWSLMRYPEVHVDEAWLTSRAWAFIQTGHQFGPLDSGLENNFKDYWIVNQWLITVLQAGVLKLSSAPSLFLVRFLSLMFGFGLLGINFIIGKKLGGQSLAVVSTLFLALSRAFFYTAHLARYEIFAVFFAYAAIAVVICDSRHRFWTGILAGILTGLAVETHLNSLIFIPALGVIYLVDDGWRFLRKQGIWGLTVGLMIGAGYYMMLHIFPNPNTFSTANSLVFGKAYIPPLLTLNLDKILSGFSDAGMLLLVGVYTMVALGLIQILAIIQKHDRLKINMLLINGILFLGAALVMPKKSAQYTILLTPAFLWLVADFCIDYFKQPWQRKIWNYASRVFVLGCIVGSFAFSLKEIIPDNYKKYQDTQAKVNAIIMDQDTVMGNQWYWFGLYTHRYYSWELLFLYPRVYPEKTLADAFNYYRPDVLIIDQQLNTLISDTVPPNSFWYSYHLPKSELDDYLARHALLSEVIKTELYGDIRIYRFTW